MSGGVHVWVVEGSALLVKALDGLADDELDAASALPGWSRRYLLAHVAANAEALGRLVCWARTGVETPMYASPRQRAADIETGSRRPVAELREWVRRSADRLVADLAELPEPAGAALVRTAQGRTVPATEIGWMRAREVNVHAVDLGNGLGFGDLPAGFHRALVGDITGWRSARPDGPALELSDGDRTWTVRGQGDPVRVELPLPELSAWLAGRTLPPNAPRLPAWL